MRLDSHMHFTPPGYRAELSQRSLLAFPLPTWSRRRALAFMDGHHIETAVLSLSRPGVAFGDQPLGDHLARLVNAAVRRAPAPRGVRDAAPDHATVRAPLHSGEAVV